MKVWPLMDGRTMAHHGVFPVQLTFCSVPFSMPVAEILPNKGARTIGKITAIYLLWGVIELMTIASKIVSKIQL
jgi:hypothetical protein